MAPLLRSTPIGAAGPVDLAIGSQSNALPPCPAFYFVLPPLACDGAVLNVGCVGGLGLGDKRGRFSRKDWQRALPIFGEAMNFEIDFLPVGEGSRAGDAIVVRYEAWPRHYNIMVVDGGTDSSGQAIADHIRTTFGADSIVSDVVSTHPDTDHSCGLRTVLRELPVQRLWVHGLWTHAAEIVELFQDRRWTAQGLEGQIEAAYPVIAELMAIARERGIDICEPFAGETIGPFTVLSPNRATYQHLIPQFRKTPPANIDVLKARGIYLNAPKGLLATILATASSAAAKLVPESWFGERLREGGTTAAENESSTVLLGNFGTVRVLLTADAGCNGLTWACENGEAMQLQMAPFALIQVPHHGSRRNVSPSVLNRLVGPIVPTGTSPTQMAIASVPKDDTHHPRKMVTNAFARRGVEVHKTQGRSWRGHYNMPLRPGEQQAEPMAFCYDVEDYD